MRNYHSVERITNESDYFAYVYETNVSFVVTISEVLSVMQQIIEYCKNNDIELSCLADKGSITYKFTVVIPENLMELALLSYRAKGFNPEKRKLLQPVTDFLSKMNEIDNMLDEIANLNIDKGN